MDRIYIMTGPDIRYGPQIARSSALLHYPHSSFNAEGATPPIRAPSGALVAPSSPPSPTASPSHPSLRRLRPNRTRCPPPRAEKSPARVHASLQDACHPPPRCRVLPPKPRAVGPSDTSRLGPWRGRGSSWQRGQRPWSKALWKRPNLPWLRTHQRMASPADASSAIRDWRPRSGSATP